jgi:hypothetical protein
MRKLIRVTQEDINNGRPDDSFNCPVALAIQRELRTNSIDVVCHFGYTKIPLVFKPLNTYYVIQTGSLLPRSANRFIKKFDAHKEVKPFNFYIEVPS